MIWTQPSGPLCLWQCFFNIPARTLTWLAQSLCHAIRTRICKALDYRGQSCHDATLCFALAILHKAMGAIHCIGWLWALHRVWCAILWSHCFVDNAPILEKFPSDKLLQTMMSQMLSLLPYSLDSIKYSFPCVPCSRDSLLLSTGCFAKFTAISIWIWSSS